MRAFRPRFRPRLLCTKRKEILIDRSTLFDPSKTEWKKSEYSTPLAKEIATHVIARGPITVSEYMKQCLTHPTHGYYTNREYVFGTKGDFTTAPEISQLFGEAIAVWVIMTWQAIGSPEKFQLIELGPGNGTLASDMIRTFDKFPPLANAIEYNFVEISEKMQRKQSDTVQSMAESMNNRSMVERCSWYSRLNDVQKSENCPNIIIGQEILDALYIHRFKYTKKGWREILVDVEQDPNAEFDFRFVTSPGDTPASSMLLSKKKQQAEKEDFGIGSTIEVGASACALVQDCATRISELGGAALFIDYGDDFAPTDSFRGISKHEFCSPLYRPGEIDLTADVDFAALRRAISHHDDIIVRGVETQNFFLKSMGIAERFEMLYEKSNSEEEKETLMRAYERLMSDKEMGELFKVFAFSSLKNI